MANDNTQSIHEASIQIAFAISTASGESSISTFRCLFVEDIDPAIYAAKLDSLRCLIFLNWPLPIFCLRRYDANELVETALTFAN